LEFERRHLALSIAGRATRMAARKIRR
jgi:hypothetical protein